MEDHDERRAKPRERPRRVALALLALLALNGPILASPLGPGPEGLDFLVGEWRIEARIQTSPIAFLEGEGTMRVGWDENHAILSAEMAVAFDRFEVNGTTRRVWDAVRKRWDVSWHPTVEGQPPVLEIEGETRGDRFVELDYGEDHYGGYVGRLVIFDIEADRFSVRKDRLYDDGTLLPGVWIYEAVRRAPEDGPGR